MESIYSNIFNDIIMTLMPENAEILLNEYGEHYSASIFWKLNNNSSRPNKRSKTIAIIISREFVEDINEMPEDLRKSTYQTLEDLIKSHLASFKADHDTPWNKPGPVEKWVITSEMLLD